jgi:transposase
MYICRKLLQMSYQVILSKIDLDIIKTKKRKERDAKLLRRYQCLSMLHENYPKKEVAKLLGVNIDTITDWVKIYTKSGLAGLGLFKYEGRRPSSLDQIKDELVDLIKKENINTMVQLQAKIKNSYTLDVEESWLGRYCKKNSISLIRKQD